MNRQPSTDGQPSLVSLFAGAGGLDIGLEQAGFSTVAAVDHDRDCCATLRGNKAKQIAIPGQSRFFLSEATILGAAIETIRGRDLWPADAGPNWRPDLLAGGPPCQPFSSAGKQLALDDPRGRLFEEFVRVADELKPRFILFENVRGLVTAPGPDGAPGGAVQLVRSEFERIGYGTSFALLNAADFGAPQRRVRLVMIGARRGRLPALPEPTHAESAGSFLFGSLRPWVTLGEFLGGCPKPNEHEIERPSQRLSVLLSDIAPGSGLKSPGAREATRPGGHWGYKQGTFVADTGKPARTVTAATSQDWVRDDVGLRRLTLRECAGLQGFPDAWEFQGNRASQFKQVGNAVPSILGSVLGQTLRLALSSGRGADRERSVSAEWPPAFTTAIRYTRKEQARNGESRKAVRATLADGKALRHQLKGVGSAESAS